MVEVGIVGTLLCVAAVGVLVGRGGLSLHIGRAGVSPTPFTIPTLDAIATIPVGGQPIGGGGVQQRLGGRLGVPVRGQASGATHRPATNEVVAASIGTSRWKRSTLGSSVSNFSGTVTQMTTTNRSSPR